MFAKRFFPARYFPPRYFPYSTGGTPPEEVSEYTEVFDFGVIISGALVNISWTSVQFDPNHSVAITCFIEASDDNVTYSDPVEGVSAFFSSCRYARVTLSFEAEDRQALVAINSLVCSVDIKYAIDSGTVYADESDTGGTEVTFNKAFKDINSITLTVAATVPITAVYDFTDTPDPTSFFVYAYDAAGDRISYLVSWKARGVI
jgi:hypothetical protein